MLSWAAGQHSNSTQRTILAEDVNEYVERTNDVSDVGHINIYTISLMIMMMTIAMIGTIINPISRDCENNKLFEMKQQ